MYLNCLNDLGADKSSTLSEFIHEKMFYKYFVDVPEKMRECADIPGVLDDAAFKHFKEDTQASLIRYDKDANQIIVLVRDAW